MRLVAVADHIRPEEQGLPGLRRVGEERRRQRSEHPGTGDNPVRREVGGTARLPILRVAEVGELTVVPTGVPVIVHLLGETRFQRVGVSFIGLVDVRPVDHQAGPVVEVAILLDILGLFITGKRQRSGPIVGVIPQPGDDQVILLSRRTEPSERFSHRIRQGVRHGRLSITPVRLENLITLGDDGA